MPTSPTRREHLVIKRCHDALADPHHDIAGHNGYPGGTTTFLRADGAFAAPLGGGGTPADSVVSETSFGLASAVGVGTDYAREDHGHGTPDDPVTAHVAAGDAHTQYQRESERNAASGYAGLDGSSKLTGSQQAYGSGANTAAEGNDGRLSDARTPTSHATSHNAGGGDALAIDAAAGTGSLRTLGTGAQQATAGNDARLSDARTPLAHAHPQSDVTSLVGDLAGKAAATHGITASHNGFPGGATTFLREDGTWATPGGGPGGNPAYNAFTQDLGVARRSGTFDLTGLSGLTADKVVNVVQTAAPVASKGNARDEPEMDLIGLTGYVVNASTIRCYWHAPSVVVGQYTFAYFVSS